MDGVGQQKPVIPLADERPEHKVEVRSSISSVAQQPEAFRVAGYHFSERNGIQRWQNPATHLTHDAQRRARGPCRFARPGR